MNYETGYVEKTHMDNGACIFQEGLDKMVIDTYKPLSYLVEKPAFQVPENRIQNIQKMNHVKHMTSMYYSIYK